MEIREHLEILQREGAALARQADHAGLGARVPSCPGWTVRDLLRHLGGVHRWASSYVAGRRTTRMPRAEKAGFMRLHPDRDGELAAWYEAGLATLTDTLSDALDTEPELRCWTFLPAPSPLAFWARRQAHETAIHRADAALAAGGDITFDADFAADGIDELLCGFLHSTLDTRAGTSTLLVDPDDAPGGWLVTVGPDGTASTRCDPGESLDPELKPDCRAEGRAALLYLALWNRIPFDLTAVHGDAAVLDGWRERSVIYWT